MAAGDKKATDKEVQDKVIDIYAGLNRDPFHLIDSDDLSTSSSSTSTSESEEDDFVIPKRTKKYDRIPAAVSSRSRIGSGKDRIRRGRYNLAKRVSDDEDVAQGEDVAKINADEKKDGENKNTEDKGPPASSGVKWDCAAAIAKKIKDITLSANSLEEFINLNNTALIRLSKKLKRITRNAPGWPDHIQKIKPDE